MCLLMLPPNEICLSRRVSAATTAAIIFQADVHLAALYFFSAASI